MILLRSFADSDFNQLINRTTDEEMLMQFAGPAFSFPRPGKMANVNER